MNVPRLAESTTRERLRTSPAVALIGPRQCGKTTLARSLKGRYFDLEQEGDWLSLDLEWERLTRARDLVILDEAQTRPEVFPRLRAAIDADPSACGRFLLLGSVSPALMRTVSESLAGRLALVELTPFVLPELDPGRMDRLWILGGYPRAGILSDAAGGGRWGADYLTLLAQRDLPQWGLPARPATIERLLAMSAAMHGQQWNASQIGQSIGVTHTTVSHYMEFLEGAFLVRTLRPWHGNIRKRLVRRPKVFWRDSGLLHALMGVADRKRLLAQPWCGASWEGFAIEQVLSTATQAGFAPASWFFRTSDGYEVDLLVELDGRRWAFEFKLGSQPGRDEVDRFRRGADMAGADLQVFVSRSEREHRDGKLWIVPLDRLLAGWPREHPSDREI